MHAPTFKHVHFPPELLHFVERHLMTSILVSVIVVGVILYLSNALAPSGSFQEFSAPATPLTLLNSPEYAHEFPMRMHYINQQLQRLQLNTHADRAYAFAYSDSTAHRGPKDVTISHVFEVTKPGMTHRMDGFQGFSRMEWLQIQSMQHSVTGFSTIFPGGYGIELYDTRNNAIGYAGLEFETAFPLLEGDEIQTLHQTAEFIEAGMSKPLNELPKIEGQ